MRPSLDASLESAIGCQNEETFEEVSLELISSFKNYRHFHTMYQESHFNGEIIVYS